MEDCWWAFNAKTTLEVSDSGIRFIKDTSFTNFKLFSIVKGVQWTSYFGKIGHQLSVFNNIVLALLKFTIDFCASWTIVVTSISVPSKHLLFLTHHISNIGIKTWTIISLSTLIIFLFNRYKKSYIFTKVIRKMVKVFIKKVIYLPKVIRKMVKVFSWQRLLIVSVSFSSLSPCKFKNSNFYMKFI
jgi:hypothetical protein